MRVEINYEKVISKKQFIAQVEVNELQDAMDFIEQFREWAESNHYDIKKVVVE